jgi:integrase
LALSTRRGKLAELRTFLARAREWDWDDVPTRPLFTRHDVPKPPLPLPRHIPRDQLDRLMQAAERLPDRQQRAALLVARWSGTRSDEIRRLTIDCLDHYPDGHPRLRVPVGKCLEERLVPLHPQAADALAELIEAAKTANPAPRYDRRAGRRVVYLFSHHGQLRGRSSLFDEALRLACEASGLLDGQGRPTITMHRFRHTVGTQLAEGGARVHTIMAILGHRSAEMANVYIHLSDATIRTEYEQILSTGGRIAGPAAESVLAEATTLTDRDVDWLKTNFFKTELELGHCLRLPQEGPCECDLYLRCPKFITTSNHAPRLRARIPVQRTLIADAQAHGWPREAERHTATLDRITELLNELGEPLDGDHDDTCRRT